MISCPNCQHQNPDGATQCEACYTPLPTTSSCPNCGAPIQSNATFCGQCGFNLVPAVASVEATQVNLPDPQNVSSIPPTVAAGFTSNPPPTNPPEEESTPISQTIPPISTPPVSTPPVSTPPVSIPPTPPVSTPPDYTMPDPDPVTLTEENKPPVVGASATQLQIQTASLFHVQTGTKIEIQQNLSVIHIGKPNDQIPPDVDVSGFPNSEIVSRVHSDIRIEGDSFFIEDVGSSNGTYVNHTPLLEGNRHRLRPGDRIALGKGDKMTFIFQMS
jgi:hypothetical protein